MTADLTPGRRAFVLRGLAFSLLGTPLAAFAATPEEVARLAQAAARMKALEDLRARAREADRQADGVAARAISLREIWDGIIDLHTRIDPAIVAARKVLQQLGTELDAGNAALREQVDAAIESRRAATRLAEEGGERLSTAAAGAEAAFARRRQAESRLQAQQRRIGTAANATADALGKVRGLISRTTYETSRLDADSKALRQAFAAMRDETRQSVEAARQARSAGWFGYVVASPALPDGEALDHLRIAIEIPLPDDEMPADGIASIFERANDSAAQAAAVAREKDAASVRQLMLAQCVGDSCAALHAEEVERKPDLDLAQAGLDGLQKRLAALRQTLPTLPDAPQTWAIEMRSWLDRVAPTLAPALDEAGLGSRGAAAFAAPLAAAAGTAYAQARADWLDAYRLAYGTTPPQPVTTIEYSAASTAAAAAPTAAAIRVLRSHAYERVSTLDGEQRGFGAYSYVLLRSGNDLDAEPVARRYKLLIDLLEAELPEGSTIPTKVTKQVNLFCIPTPASGSGPGKAGRPRYGAALAGQWLLNAQHGLLTRKEILTRLIRSPGPFLLTLPGRIAESAPGMPLLLADLNDYPDMAIRDLVTQYMEGLLDSFPTDQAQWKPPALQQVALTMIHMAGDLGRIVERAIPSAVAGGH